MNKNNLLMTVVSHLAKGALTRERLSIGEGCLSSLHDLEKHYAITRSAFYIKGGSSLYSYGTNEEVHRNLVYIL